MTIYEVLVDGKVALTVPGELRSDGAIWSPSGAPLINGVLLAQAGISKEAYGRAARAGKFTASMLACCLRLGENPCGRTVRDKTAADRTRAQRAETEMTPANRERREIDRLFAKAERCDRSEDDVEYYNLRCEAKSRLEKWQRLYPTEYARERADAIRAKAQHRRDLAAGAMTYDCDGSLSYNDQCSRRDEMLEEAASLDAEADAISAR